MVFSKKPKKQTPPKSLEPQASGITGDREMEELEQLVLLVKQGIGRKLFACPRYL